MFPSFPARVGLPRTRALCEIHRPARNSRYNPAAAAADLILNPIQIPGLVLLYRRPEKVQKLLAGLDFGRFAGQVGAQRQQQPRQTA